MCLVNIEASSTFTADVVGPAFNTVRVSAGLAGVAIQRESAIAYTANGRTIASLTSTLACHTGYRMSDDEVAVVAYLAV